MTETEDSGCRVTKAQLRRDRNSLKHAIAISVVCMMLPVVLFVAAWLYDPFSAERHGGILPLLVILLGSPVFLVGLIAVFFCCRRLQDLKITARRMKEELTYSDQQNSPPPAKEDEK